MNMLNACFYVCSLFPFISFLLILSKSGTYFKLYSFDREMAHFQRVYYFINVFGHMVGNYLKKASHLTTRNLGAVYIVEHVLYSNFIRVIKFDEQSNIELESFVRN